MAGRIAGITIEIGGDTTKLQSSLKAVDGQLRQTQTALKDVNKLLKLDPGNTELLRQKQTQLQTAIEKTKERLEQLKSAQAQFAEGSAEWDAIQREIIATEQNLQALENEYRQFGSVAAQQIKAAGEKMAEFGNKVSGVGQKLRPLSRTAAGIGAGLLGLGYKAVTTADDLNTLAKQTGFTTEEIQQMQYAADLVDVSFEDISGALKKVKKNMTGHAETWAALGVSVTDAEGNMRDATDVFYDSLQALSQIENETERDQMAMDLFGKSADQLAGIIDDGGEALKEYGEQAKDLGVILDQDTLDSMNELNDTVDELKANFGATFIKLGSSIASALAPALATVAEKAGVLAEKIRNLTPEQSALILKIVGVVAAIAPLLIVGGKLITGIGKILTFAPLIATAISAITLPMALMAAKWAVIIAVGTLVIKNWDKIKATAVALKDAVVNAWSNLKESTIAGWQATKTEVATAWDNMKTKTSEAVANIKTAVVNSFTSLKSSVSSIFNSIKSTASSVWNGIKSTITTAINSAKSAVQTAVNAIKDMFNFSFSMPHIPLPHFSVSPPGWKLGDLLKGTIPSLSIDWYKKAYDNPILFSSPTVMSTPGGLKGFGDGHGAEIVMGLNKLQELVGASGDVIINVTPAPGMDVNQLADQIQARFVQLQKQRSLAYA